MVSAFCSPPPHRLKVRREKFGALAYDYEQGRLFHLYSPRRASGIAGDELLLRGLGAPLCLTWEITYDCNLHCIHCLSSAGNQRDKELSLKEAKGFLDELAEMQVFYINIGGGEPLLHPNFFEIVEYATQKEIGVNFSTNGTLIDRSIARHIAELDYVDVQVSLDGATPEVNDQIRGAGSFHQVLDSIRLLKEAGSKFKVNTVITRINFPQLDALYETAKSWGGILRLSRLRPAGRGREIWRNLHLSQEQNFAFYLWMKKHPDVLTADSFFHLSPLGERLPGLNLCGAGRLVCGLTPAGEVYACAFLQAEPFYAGNIRKHSFSAIWKESPALLHLRNWSPCRGCQAFNTCHGGCIAAKYFTGTDLDAPDPECVVNVGD